MIVSYSAFWLTAVALGLSLINAAVQYHQARKEQEGLEDDRGEGPNVPHVSEGGVIPVIFGTVHLTGPNVITTGLESRDVAGVRIRESFTRTSPGEVYGGRYHNLNIHMVFCQGPIDEVVEIRAGSERLYTIENGESFDDVDVIGSWDLREHRLSTGESILPIDDGPSQLTQDRRGDPSKLNMIGWRDAAGFRRDFELMNGYPDQPESQQLRGYEDADPDIIPHYRGVFGVNGRIVWPENGRLDDISVVVTRDRTGSFGQALTDSPASGGLAASTFEPSGEGMNAVAIIEECLVDGQWGLATPREHISDQHFSYASTDAKGGAMVLSGIWDSRQPFGDWVAEVLRHIDGALYIEPQTGQYVIRMVRDDYDLDAMLQQDGAFDTKEIINIGPDDIIGDLKETRVASRDLVNEVTITYPDREAGRDRSFTQHDTSAQRYRQPVSSEIKYPLVHDGGLAARLAARDLAELSQPLRMFSLSIPADIAKSLRPVDVFVLSYPTHGIVEMACRVTNITGSNVDEQTIEIEAVQDVFSLSAAITAPPDEIDIELLRESPTPAEMYISEMPYWWEIERLRVDEGRENTRDDEALSQAMGRIMAASWTSQRAASSWDMTTDPVPRRSGEWGFSPIFKVDFHQALNGESASGVLVLADEDDGADPAFEPLSTDTRLYFEVGGVIVAAKNWDLDLGTADFDIGLFDTVPGYPTLTIGGEYPLLAYGHRDVNDRLNIRRVAGADQIYRHIGETPTVKSLPRTSRGVLEPAATPGEAVEVTGRLWRPYPPGRLRIDDEKDGEDPGEISVSWRSRWRAGRQVDQATSEFITIDEPESFWRITIYEASAADLDTLTELREAVVEWDKAPPPSTTVMEYIYTNESEREDRGEPPGGDLAEVIVFKIEGLRDGVASWQATPRTLIRD